MGEAHVEQTGPSIFESIDGILSGGEASSSSGGGPQAVYDGPGLTAPLDAAIDAVLGPEAGQ
jgi:hypothetical protein